MLCRDRGNDGGRCADIQFEECIPIPDRQSFSRALPSMRCHGEWETLHLRALY